jgi:hypothetical protein
LILFLNRPECAVYKHPSFRDLFLPDLVWLFRASVWRFWSRPRIPFWGLISQLRLIVGSLDSRLEQSDFGLLPRRFRLTASMFRNHPLSLARHQLQQVGEEQRCGENDQHEGTHMETKSTLSWLIRFHT